MRASVFLHRFVTNDIVFDSESSDQLKERAGHYFGIRVGVIFNDCGAAVQDNWLIQPSTTLVSHSNRAYAILGSSLS